MLNLRKGAGSLTSGLITPVMGGWLNLISGSFIEARKGHTAALLENFDAFGFMSLNDVVYASERNSLKWDDGRPRGLTGRSLDELIGLLDGDEGIWQTVYDRNWIRIMHYPHTARLLFVVQDAKTAQSTVHLLSHRFAIESVVIDLYDRPTERVTAAYRLDSEALDHFLRFGRLLSHWKV